MIFSDHVLEALREAEARLQSLYEQDVGNPSHGMLAKAEGEVRILRLAYSGVEAWLAYQSVRVLGDQVKETQKRYRDFDSEAVVIERKRINLQLIKDMENHVAALNKCEAIVKSTRNLRPRPAAARQPRWQEPSERRL